MSAPVSGLTDRDTIDDNACCSFYPLPLIIRKIRSVRKIRKIRRISKIRNVKRIRNTRNIRKIRKVTIIASSERE